MWSLRSPTAIAPVVTRARGACRDLYTGTIQSALDTTGIETVPLTFEVQAGQSSTGPKSPLYIIHGLFGSKANNRTMAKTLAKDLGRDVFCLDLRNFGQSPHSKRLDYPSMAADVERFIETHHPDTKPILIGHSMGAKAVMSVALRRPELPKMIISVDNAPVDLGGSGGSFSKYVNQLRVALEKHKYTNIKDVDGELAKVEPNQTIRQFLLMNLNRGKKDDVITSKIPLDVVGKAITTGQIAAWPFDSNISRWTNGPALFVRGTESKYIPDDVIPDIGKYFPDFEVADIKAGHWVISEKPEEFRKVVVDWIERKEDD
mgnify:CR=1 FL=1